MSIEEIIKELEDFINNNILTCEHLFNYNEAYYGGKKQGFWELLEFLKVLNEKL